MDTPAIRVEHLSSTLTLVTLSPTQPVQLNYPMTSETSGHNVTFAISINLETGTNLSEDSLKNMAMNMYKTLKKETKKPKDSNMTFSGTE